MPLISEPDKELVPWKGRTGFCQELWHDGVIQQQWGFRPSPDNTHVFLCGNPLMIEEMLKVLGEAGFAEHSRRSPGQVHLEKYW
jgi:ferredoxin/flavodoxin---NADP+ reductase